MQYLFCRMSLVHDEDPPPTIVAGQYFCLTGRRITGKPGQNAVLDGRCPVHPRGCAALRAAQAADVDPPPRCRGREASATTIDYTISAYLP